MHFITTRTNKEIPHRQKLIQRILEIEKRYSGRFLEDIDELAEHMLDGIEEKGSRFLCDLDDRKDSPDDVRLMVEMFPSALSHHEGYENECGEVDCIGLPIYYATMDDHSKAFIPLLAEEGMKRNMKETCGGLFDENNEYEASAIELEITNCPGNECLDILKELRSLDVLTKEDIHDKGLASMAIWRSSKEVCDYIIDWNPSILKKDGSSHLINEILYANAGCDFLFPKERRKVAFQWVLEAGMRHCPQDVGFLFHSHSGDKEDNVNETFLERAIKIFGRGQTFEYIQKSISSSCEFPILHHAIKHTPQYLVDFTKIFPDAWFSMDADGRSVNHALLANGKTFKEDPLFFVRLSDDDINNKDPVTDLYPFMLVAAEIDVNESSRSSDLETINYLLRRSPAVLDESRRRQRNRKRKRAIWQ